MASITFQSNQTVQGTSGDDSMVGNDTAGNNNDIVYGRLGNDTITFNTALSNSTVYGGLGNDSIVGDNGDLLYGNFGDDTLLLFGNTSTGVIPSGDALYGGQGNDFLHVLYSNSDVLYGNQGDDAMYLYNDTLQVAYGGQGSDNVGQHLSALGVLYGNQGNDFVADDTASGFNGANSGTGVAEGSSVLYGGKGDDTLIAGAAGGDSMFGGLGHNLFAGNAQLSNSAFTANDLILVEDFVTGNDHLAVSHRTAGQAINPFAAGFLTKEDNPLANNAVIAMSEANSFYASDTIPGYVFIYGGAGAGYLFYNGDAGGGAVNDGMILAGNNGEGSLQANDVVASIWV